MNLKDYHSFRLQAECHQIVELNSLEQVQAIQPKSPFYFLGEGTNTLFLTDFEGTVFLNRLKGIQIKERESAYHVRVKAGENWHQLVLLLNQQGINGLENLALIPGSVGAAPVQNIGAYGVEVASYIDKVISWDCQHHKEVVWSKAECEFGYRTSRFKQIDSQHLLITEVCFTFPKLWQPVLTYKELQPLQHQSVSAAEIMNQVIKTRQAKLPDPEVIFNAGSFFKNPIITQTQADALIKKYPNLPCYPDIQGQVKIAAGWLIEQAGFKGVSVGDAQVYQKQALVLINKGQATGSELIQLATNIQKQVKVQFGVELEPEVQLIYATGRR